MTTSVEIKSIKVNTRMSEETYCFDAVVYIDGKRAGTVMNHGHGGGHLYRPMAIAAQINERVSSMPPEVLKEGDRTMELKMDAELFINNLVHRHMIRQDLKRLCKRGTCVRLPGQHYGQGSWELYKVPFDAAFALKLRAKHGNDVLILNEDVERFVTEK